jgi:chromosome segregation ATPase
MKELTSNPAVAVFLGTLPLLGAIIWSLLDQRTRFMRLETKLDSVDGKLGAIDVRLAKVETRVDSIDTRLGKVETRLESVDGRLAKVELRLEGGRLVTGD